jgi:hypothetical protein
MKILKLIKDSYGHYKAIFDNIPEITYEKIGSDYVGSCSDEEGNIIFSHHLTYNSWGKAFAGREISLTMKNNSISKIKDYWYDNGSYQKHGEFISIGSGILEELQHCYVYCSMNINRFAFDRMVEDYLTREKIYEYREVEEWCKLQYKWYNVIVNGKQIPFMMNEYGNMVEKETKKHVYARYNVCKKVNDKYKNYTFFKFQYKNNSGKLIKIEANYLETLKATLPLSEEDIKVKCKLQ